MELINTLYQVQRPAASDKIALAAIREALETAIILLAPIVPHMTEELWEILGQRKPLSEVGWPEFDKSIASEEEITIVIQINGKLRSRITVAVDEEAESIKAAALADEKIALMLKGTNVLKVIYVPKKLVNIVVAQ
jgi:leucyl-tRNA synthetase